jgi:hypothetical protein
METFVKKKLAILSAAILDVWTTSVELFSSYPGSVDQKAFYLVMCVLLQSRIISAGNTASAESEC